jgi:oligoendopeptidase F
MKAPVGVPLPQKEKRHFIPETLRMDVWEDLEPVYKGLAERPLNSYAELGSWLSDMSEFDSAIQEHAGWLYIRMTCDTRNKEATDAYVHFVNDIQPKIAPYEDRLNRKFDECPWKDELPATYRHYKISVANSIRLFREKNIPLLSELQVKEQKFGEISGAMTV